MHVVGSFAQMSWYLGAVPGSQDGDNQVRWNNVKSQYVESERKFDRKHMKKLDKHIREAQSLSSPWRDLDIFSTCHAMLSSN